MRFLVGREESTSVDEHESDEACEQHAQVGEKQMSKRYANEQVDHAEQLAKVREWKEGQMTAYGLYVA